MGKMDKIREWLSGIPSPFAFFDNISLFKVGDRPITWGFRAARLRTFCLVVSVISMGMWMYFGFDSTIHYFFKGIPILASIFGYTENEGAGFHWSTISLYSLQFFLMSYWLSKYKDKIGDGTRNFFFTCMAMLATGGIFEIIWMSLYDIIHFQDLALWAFGDGTVFWRNVAWLIALPLSYLVISAGTEYKPLFRLDRTFWILVFLAIGGWTFWVFYPLSHVVFSEYGNVGSNLFPQTVYTCKGILAEGGISLAAVYIYDFWVHFTNVMVKYFSAFPFIYMFKVKIIHKSGFDTDRGEWVE